MGAKLLAIYRLPTASAARIGQLRVVTDRNHQHYVDGSRVVEVIRGERISTIRLADGRDFYVLTKEYMAL